MTATTRRSTPRSQKSFADPDAQMMRTGDGALTYAYNAQAAVSEDGWVVASGLTTEVRDTGQLGSMIPGVEANTGEPPGVAVADAISPSTTSRRCEDRGSAV